MALVDDFLDLVQSPRRAAVMPGQPSSDALLALLVHMAFSDGEVDAGEFSFLERVLPGREPGELMVSDDRLYWFNDGDGTIMYLSR